MYFSNILTHRGNNNLWKFHSIDAIKRILLIVLRNALRRCDRLSRSDSLLRGTTTRNLLEIIIPGSLIVSNARRCLYLFSFQGDGNIPYNINENRHSTQVFILLFVEKEKNQTT